MLICDESMSWLSDMRHYVQDFFNSDIDFVYKLVRYEGFACPSFYIHSDNEDIPSCCYPCSTRPRGKFCFMFTHPK